jgi:hypothetical protein
MELGSDELLLSIGRDIGLLQPIGRKRLRANINVQEARFHNIEILPNVSLPNYHFILDDPPFLHRI